MLLSLARASVRQCARSLRCGHGLVPLALALRAPWPVARPRWLSATPAPSSSTSATAPADIGAQDAVAALSACTGCGALAQTVEPGEAGYYDLRRPAIKKYLAQLRDAPDPATHTPPDPVDEPAAPPAPPVCNRCHALLHANAGAPIAHPSVASLRATIAESPHRAHHIYHVLDAADFPLSLVPTINELLAAAPLRSRNRRARDAAFAHGRRIELSFVITRSDLLAPRKEQVDALMPYLVDVLRGALGRAGRGVRLGNVRCVSAHRGWWTREIKADITRRGGANWMVGKANVGKSNLFDVVFPKGGAQDVDVRSVRDRASSASAAGRSATEDIDDAAAAASADSLLLLPPARAETPYPVMPTVSSLAGTTASPIRIPFSRGRGELIDLPGLARDDLASFLRPGLRGDSILMKARVRALQQVLTPRRVLMLGGLVAIAPRTDGLTFLVCQFTPLKPFTYTDRSDRSSAEGSSIELRKVPPNLSVAADGVTDNLKSAGRFQLKWDVTSKRAGPLVRKDAVGLKASQLPFRVLAVDIVIEGVGWVEVAAQVRRKDFPDNEDGKSSISYPEIDVYSPEGRFVGVRKPMNAYSLNKPSREKPGPRRKDWRKGKTDAKPE